MTPEIKVFCCYARKDQLLLQELKNHLMPLQREELISVWADTDITPGSEWEKEIDQQLDTARIILLLISPDFMASDYCYSQEMKQALNKHKKGEACVIPIILRSVSWQGTPIGKLQALPANTKPIKEWSSKDKAFLEVTKGIRQAIEKISASQQTAKQIAALPRIPDPPINNQNPQPQVSLHIQDAKIPSQPSSNAQPMKPTYPAQPASNISSPFRTQLPPDQRQHLRPSLGTPPSINQTPPAQPSQSSFNPKVSGSFSPTTPNVSPKSISSPQMPYNAQATGNTPQPFSNNQYMYPTYQSSGNRQMPGWNTAPPYLPQPVYNHLAHQANIPAYKTSFPYNMIKIRSTNGVRILKKSLFIGFKLLLYLFGMFLAETGLFGGVVYGTQSIKSITDIAIGIGLIIGFTGLVISVVIFFRKGYYLYRLRWYLYLWGILGTTFFAIIALALQTSFFPGTSTGTPGGVLFGIVFFLYGLSLVVMAHLKSA